MLPPWTDPFAFARYALAVNAVVAIRLSRLSRGGPGAAIEFQRMIGEKVLAAGLSGMAAGQASLLGAAPMAVAAAGFRPYAKALSANRRRLGR